MTPGNLFPDISLRRGGEPKMGSLPVTSDKNVGSTEEAHRSGGTQARVFASLAWIGGGVLTRAQAGDSLSTIVQEAY